MRFCDHLIRLLPFVVLAVVSITVAEESRKLAQRYEVARKLEESGQAQAAFLAYAPLPGATHKCVQIARSKPEEYLALLREKGTDVPVALSKLIEGVKSCLACELVMVIDAVKEKAKTVGGPSIQRLVTDM